MSWGPDFTVHIDRPGWVWTCEHSDVYETGWTTDRRLLLQIQRGRCRSCNKIVVRVDAGPFVLPKVLNQRLFSETNPRVSDKSDRGRDPDGPAKA
jgi:hypothetical protein